MPNTTAKAIDFSEREILLIKKYRQLDADGKALVDSIIDTRLMQLGGRAEEKEEALG
ncbi:MAG: hypothetical protein ACI3WS_08285 [Phascolarctobacterium sp.]